MKGIGEKVNNEFHCVLFCFVFNKEEKKKKKRKKKKNFFFLLINYPTTFVRFQSNQTCCCKGSFFVK